MSLVCVQRVKLATLCSHTASAASFPGKSGQRLLHRARNSHCTRLYRMAYVSENMLSTTLSGEVQSISDFLDRQRLQQGSNLESLAFTACRGFQQAGKQLAAIRSKQVVLEAKLTASYKREEACHQQLQSRAVSAAGAQHLKANLEAEELLRGNYLKQSLTLKSSLQDLLRMLSDSLAAAEQPEAASEASRLAELIVVPDAAVHNVLHTNRKQRHCSRAMVNSHNDSFSTQVQNPSPQQHKKAAVTPRTLDRSGGKASWYQRQRATNCSVGTDNSPLSSPGLEPARCSLADSCSSFIFSDERHNPSSPREQLNSNVECHKQPVSTDEDADAQAPVSELKGQDFLKQSLLRSHPVRESRAPSPENEDSIAQATSSPQSRSPSTASVQREMHHTEPGISGRQASIPTGSNSRFLLQALENCVQQMEVRLSIAESGRSAAEQQVAELQQQLLVAQKAGKERESQLLQQLAQQEVVLAAAAVHLGPLESQANPISPIATPRLQQQLDPEPVSK